MNEQEGIVVYWSSVSGNLLTKREQQHIFDTLASMKIPYRVVDVATDGPAKTFLRENSPQQLVMPQIFVDGGFRAGYERFVEAVEEGRMTELLQGDAKEFPLH